MINIKMGTAEIKDVEDIRKLFTVDSQFVNRDGEFYEVYDLDEEVPFDNVIKKTDWRNNLDETISKLGLALMEFDGDFQNFEYNIVEVGDTKVVSVVFVIM